MKLKVLLLLSIVSGNSYAVKLADYKPFQFEALFTNPVCETYNYDRAVITHSGKTVNSKPDDVYCKPADEAASVARKNSPQYRLVEWITAKDTKEIHAAYLWAVRESHLRPPTERHLFNSLIELQPLVDARAGDMLRLARWTHRCATSARGG